MTRPELTSFNTIIPLFVQEYEHYLPTAFDESLSLLQKVNKIIQKMNELGDVSNSVIEKWNEVMTWLMDEGLHDEVLAILQGWLDDGTLADLINDLLGRFNPIDYLQNQETIGFVNNQESGNAAFIQGIAFNQDQNELYVVRKDNTQATNVIYRYDATTLLLKDSKSFVTSVGCFNEGLAYFYNAAGNLCFIVRTEYDFKVNIFNYTLGTLGTEFNSAGSSKHGMDNHSNYYFAHFGDSDTVEGIYLYDFESVKNGSPSLLKKIYFPRNIADGEKVQTISIIDDSIYLGHGKQYPQVSVLNFSGDVIQEHAFDKTSLLNMLKKQHPDITLINYSYENEGMGFYTENGKVYPLMAHSISELGRSYLTKMGDPVWEKVDTKVYHTNVDGELNWKAIPYASGVSNYGSDVAGQYAKDKMGYVHLRGVCTYTRDPAHTDATQSFDYNKTLFTLPYPYQPFRNTWYKTQASGGADRANRINVQIGGSVVLESVYDQAGSATPFCVLDGIKFYVDTRTS